ncbi:MAG: DNA double-strand break repair nuclease NurA [Chloroflexota bacterium]|nr:DNA double-strand break repair nuclease NurA [Chloroflexota bacterium]
MSLEFNQVVDQVQRMGRYLGTRWSSAAGKLDLALERFDAACDLALVQARIDMVRGSGVSGYRGAAPLSAPYAEIVCGVGEPSAAPERATIVAVDGSQIYPDAHSPALYYLVNIGAFIYHYGETRLPRQHTTPELYYTESALEDKDGRPVNNQTVNARRTVMELKALAARAWELRDDPSVAAPIITLHDGGLLKFFGATEITDARTLEKDYWESLEKLRESGAVLAGYPGAQRATYVVSLLHLLSLPPDQVNDANLKTNGDLEGLSDTRLYSEILNAGQRSAVMVQNSPQNYDYKTRLGVDYEIAFFYLNVSGELNESPRIARIDIPMWVATNPAAVDALQALILHQCAIQGRKRYPYALTRADEMAYISSTEKAQIDQLIRVSMLENGLMPEESEKLQTKGLARGARRQHRLQR